MGCWRERQVQTDQDVVEHALVAKQADFLESADRAERGNGARPLPVEPAANSTLENGYARCLPKKDALVAHLSFLGARGYRVPHQRPF
jgi:hypothetical protein